MDRSVVDDVEELTDPQPFGPPHHPDEVTKRRCVGCGAELEPDAAAFMRGVQTAYNSVYAVFRRRGLTYAEATAVIDEALADSGINLV